MNRLAVVEITLVNPHIRQVRGVALVRFGFLCLLIFGSLGGCNAEARLGSAKATGPIKGDVFTTAMALVSGEESLPRAADDSKGTSTEGGRAEIEYQVNSDCQVVRLSDRVSVGVGKKCGFTGLTLDDACAEKTLWGRRDLDVGAAVSYRQGVSCQYGVDLFDREKPHRKILRMTGFEFTEEELWAPMAPSDRCDYGRPEGTVLAEVTLGVGGVVDTKKFHRRVDHSHEMLHTLSGAKFSVYFTEPPGENCGLGEVQSTALLTDGSQEVASFQRRFFNQFATGPARAAREGETRWGNIKLDGLHLAQLPWVESDDSLYGPPALFFCLGGELMGFGRPPSGDRYIIDPTAAEDDWVHRDKDTTARGSIKHRYTLPLYLQSIDLVAPDLKKALTCSGDNILGPMMAYLGEKSEEYDVLREDAWTYCMFLDDVSSVWQFLSAPSSIQPTGSAEAEDYWSKWLAAQPSIPR